MPISGLENHKQLHKYVLRVEKYISERNDEDAKVNLRKCTECIVNEYLKEYPLCAGEDLFTSIENLQKVLSEDTFKLLHALRKAGNDGGAHVKDNSAVYENEIDKVNGLYRRLLNYLPEFIDKFPIPSEKPVPKTGDATGLGFEIDFESIQPLELHPNWRNCIGYQEMLTFREMLEFQEYIEELHKTHRDDELFYWLWCVMLIDRLNLIINDGEKEYLNIRKIVKYYYEALENNDYASWMKYPAGRYGYCYIPAIIREYFPDSLAYFHEGKGYVWEGYTTLFGETSEDRLHKEVDALVHGNRAMVAPYVCDKIQWYTVGKKQEAKRKEQEKDRQLRAAAHQKAQVKKREEAKEAARREQERKDYEERVKKSVERREKEIRDYQLKILKPIGIIALIPLTLLRLMTVWAIVKNILVGGFTILFKILVPLALIVILAIHTWSKFKKYFK